MKIIAFRTRKPKRFTYKPLYYDERKEELEKLKKKYSEPAPDGISPDFRDRLRSSWHIKEQRTGNISRATLIAYLVVAMLLLYLIFFY